MKKIYVAGAYSADNVISVLQNIGRGQHYASMLLSRGYAPFCPWLDKEYVINNYLETPPLQQFYDYSTAWLSVSDAMFVVPDLPGLNSWRDSMGTKQERHFALENNIPVFYNLEELEEWGKNESK